MCLEEGVNILAMPQGILWVAQPMLEIIGRTEVFGSCILGEPYNVDIVGKCSMREFANGLGEWVVSYQRLKNGT